MSDSGKIVLLNGKQNQVSKSVLDANLANAFPSPSIPVEDRIAKLEECMLMQGAQIEVLINHLIQMQEANADG